MKSSAGRALMFFWLIMGITLLNCPAHATDVAGIIDTDTFWDLSGSLYIVTGGILSLSQQHNVETMVGISKANR